MIALAEATTDAAGHPAGVGIELHSRARLLQSRQPSGQLLRQIHLDSARSPCTPRTGRQHTDTPMQPPAGSGHAQREPQLSPRPPGQARWSASRLPLARDSIPVSRTGLLHAPNDSYTAVWPSTHPIPPGAAAPRPPAKTAPNPQPLQGTQTSLISKASSVSYTTPPIHAYTRARVKPRLVNPDNTARPSAIPKRRQRENTVIVF